MSLIVLRCRKSFSQSVFAIVTNISLLYNQTVPIIQIILYFIMFVKHIVFRVRMVLLKAMRHEEGFEKITQHSSHKVIQLLNILKEYNPDVVQSNGKRGLHLTIIIIMSLLTVFGHGGSVYSVFLYPHRRLPLATARWLPQWRWRSRDRLVNIHILRIYRLIFQAIWCSARNALTELRNNNAKSLPLPLRY